MKLNNTEIIYATEDAKKQFEGKKIKDEKSNDCPSCEIEIKEKKEGKI